MRNDNSYQQDSWQMGMNSSLLMFLAGVGTGAALMYFLDPDRGGRRRALLMDQAVSIGNDAREAFDATTEDLSNRAYGLYAETRKAVGSPLPSNRDNQSNTIQSDDNQMSDNQTGLVTEMRRTATQS
jgi:hypothetical protein